MKMYWFSTFIKMINWSTIYEYYPKGGNSHELTSRLIKPIIDHAKLKTSCVMVMIRCCGHVSFKM